MKQLFSRDALETVIFETMLEIDESAVEDPTEMENQLAAMEQDLEDFPSEDEQNLMLLQKHVELIELAVARHKVVSREFLTPFFVVGCTLLRHAFTTSQFNSVQ